MKGLRGIMNHCSHLPIRRKHPERSAREAAAARARCGAAAAEHKAKLSGEFCGNYVVDQVMEWNSPLSFPPSPRIDISREGRRGSLLASLIYHFQLMQDLAKEGQRSLSQ